MATANVELPAVNSIGSWAEAVEEDCKLYTVMLLMIGLFQPNLFANVPK